MAYASKAGRAVTNPRDPRAQAVCDRCGIWYNHDKLRFQWDWAGAGMINKQILCCYRCLDKPQEQLRAIVLPADPVPIQNPRPEQYVTAETSPRITGYERPTLPRTGIPVPPPGNFRLTQADRVRVPQQTGEPPFGINEEPGTDPTGPQQDPGLPYGNDEVPKTGPLD